MPRESRPKGRVIKSASRSHKGIYIIAAIAIAIVAGLAGWYGYSSAHSIVTTARITTSRITTVSLSGASGDEFVRILTNYGVMSIELFQNDTPQTVANFLQLVNSGFYKGLIWYRIVRETNPTLDLIQIGDPTATNGSANPCLWGLHGSSTNVPLEIVPSLNNSVGYIGLWYPTGDPGGGSSQFYINLSDNAQLNGNHTVFGKVLSGLNVAQAIGNLPINSSCGSATEGPPENPSNVTILNMAIEE